MRKYIKFISLIIVLLLTLTLFVGCNKTQAPNGRWKNYEKYSYEVENTIDGVIQSGTMTMEITRLTNQNISVGDYSVNDFIGTEIKYNLTMNNGEEADDTIEVKAYFLSNSFSPIISSKIYNTKALTKTIYAKYEGNNYIYKIDGAEKSLSIKKKTPIVDNEVIYTVLRAYDLTANFSQIFYVPSPMQDALQSVTASTFTASEKVRNRQSDSDVECIGINITLNSKLSGGQSLKVYYSKNDLEYSKDGEEKAYLNRVPIKIVEGNVSFYLKSIDDIKTR